MKTLLVVATHNTHKTDEIREMVGSSFESVVDLTAYPEIEPAVEDGDTFEANSAIKAMAAAEALPDAFILADDSGLEVDGLGGAPGVYSARYAGEGASDQANREKLMSALGDDQNRSARFRCVLTVVKGAEKLAVFSGACEGGIADSEQGDGGFGYDPIFIPEGYDQTFGQLSTDTKNHLSHRAVALQQFSSWLHEVAENLD